MKSKSKRGNVKAQSKKYNVKMKSRKGKGEK